ncbi:hypothetical protein ACWDSD_41680 [Streptomyces spiralis]
MSELLRALHEAGAEQAVATLTQRAITRVQPSDIQGIADLLGTLREIGAQQAINALAQRTTDGKALE